MQLIAPRVALRMYYTAKAVEPGIVEYRCSLCNAGFETDTKMSELYHHLEQVHFAQLIDV